MCMKFASGSREFTTTTKPVKTPCRRTQPSAHTDQIRTPLHPLGHTSFLQLSPSHRPPAPVVFFQGLMDIRFEVPVYQDGWKQSGSLGV